MFPISKTNLEQFVKGQGKTWRGNQKRSCRPLMLNSTVLTLPSFDLNDAIWGLSLEMG